MQPNTKKIALPPWEREAAFIEKYSVIEDLQERLQAVCTHRSSVPPLPEHLCVDENLVRGCSSPVWLCGKIEDGSVMLAMASPTLLVSSLAGIVCDFCHGAPVCDICSWEPHWLQGLRIDRHLSSTRQNGIAAILKRIREIATQPFHT